jgi:hypothetical protein
MIMDQDNLEHSSLSPGPFSGLKIANNNDYVLLPHSPSMGLILEKSSFSSIKVTPAHDSSSSHPRSETGSQAGCVVSKIEDILENMIDCISGEKKELVIHLKPRFKQVPSSVHQAMRHIPNTKSRTVRFPGKTLQEAWKFSKD